MPPRRRTRLDALGPEAAVSQSLAVQVYELLKSEILSGQRAPGSILIEPELASRYGISKTPVREALQLLTRDRWVTVLPRRGYQITPLALGDLAELFALRLMIEPELAGVAARRRTSEQLAGLVGIVDKAIAAQNGAPARGMAPEPIGVPHFAADFHLALAAIAGNERALRILTGLVEEVTRLRNLLPDVDHHLNSTHAVKEHQELIEALMRHDSERATESMREHLNLIRTAMVAAFSV